ncbi:threonine/serine dehydratase [SAR202 cluster bacterium AD-804-J14_MRT_500m]|nr:threonine/serine dehydratase [SAR202 cluster bacterium AD-804-J14_MRT_500m]
MEIPNFLDVLEARKTISPYIARTPLYSYAGVNEIIDADVKLKHENHHPLGAFKVRGGINLLAHSSREQLDQGFITASTGNHGQSVANACKLFGASAVVVVPEGANYLKVEAMRNLGAEVVFRGNNFDESKAYSEFLAQKNGYRFVHAANEPLLIAGVGTAYLEVIEDFPDVEYMFVPLGGGSGVSSACIVAKSINPHIKVIAVQSEQAPAGYLSWKEGNLVEAPSYTIAEGLATQNGYELPQTIMRDYLDDFVLVTDEEIYAAIRILIEKAHTLTEGAGAAAMAGALKVKNDIRGKKVAIAVSGGNITLANLREAISERP